MSKILKRILAGTLAAAAAVSMTACSGGGNETAEGGSQKHFSVFINGSTEEPSDDNKIMKKIEEELGYTFDFEYLVGNEAEKVGVMIAGGEYPDIVSCGDNTFAQTGALVPLEDYISEEKGCVGRRRISRSKNVRSIF